MKRVGALTLAASLVLVAWADSGDLDVAFIDVGSYPIVTIVFTPPEAMRDTTIEPADVVLTQDGENVGFTIRSLEQEPLEAVLAIDVSGSMAGRPLEDARAAAADFIALLPDDSRVTVIAFGDSITVVAPPGSDHAAATAAMATLTAGGETAMYDATIAAVSSLSPDATVRRVVLLLSDGGDTVSTAGLVEVTAALTELDIGFYAIALRGSEYDPTALQQVTEAARGSMVHAADSQALGEIYTAIATELAAQVAVTFKPLHGGTSHFTLTVRSDVGDLTSEFELGLPADAVVPVAPGDVVPSEPHTWEAGNVPPPRSVQPPPTRLVPSGGILSGPAAKWFGIASLAAVLTLAIGLALLPAPAGRRRGAWDLGQTGPASPEWPGGRAHEAVSAMQERVERILERRGGTTPLLRRLEAAGSSLQPGEYTILVLAAGAVAITAGLVISGPIAAGIGAFLVLLASRGTLMSRAARRRSAFDDQLEGTLQLIAGSLRAGYGITQAINAVATEAADPTAAEFRRVVTETRLGRDLIDSLSDLAARMESLDFRWVAQAIDIQHGVGGDLAEILDTIAETIRDRNRIRRQVKALSAEGRLSAVILIGLPFGLAGLMTITSPDYLGELTTTTAGRGLLALGGVFMAIGIAWIRKIIRIEY